MIDVLGAQDERVHVEFSTVQLAGLGINRAALIAAYIGLRDTAGYAGMDHSHSHSILSIHRNALIHQPNFFLPMLGIRTTTRQTFLLMIPKENPCDSNSAQLRELSTTIDRFLADRSHSAHLRAHEKTP